MGKHILITGGAGFVGSYLCRELLKENYAVTVIDDLSNGNEDNISDGVDFYKLDISEEYSLDKLPNRSYECVIHCAAQSSNALSFIDPKRDLLVNQLGTLNVLKFCVKRSIKRIVFTSSMSAYGETNRLPTKENVAMYPDSFYAVHKLGSEHYLRIFSQQYGINYTIFRLYTTYGHGQNLENINQGLLSIYLSYIVNKKTIIVKGSKERTRDIIHVSDVVKAIMLSLKSENSYNKIYNLGTGKSLKIMEIIDLLTAGMGYEPGVYPVVYVEGTAGDPFDTLASIQNVKKDLNWEPIISAREGIKLTLEAYKTI